MGLMFGPSAQWVEAPSEQRSQPVIRLNACEDKLRFQLLLTLGFIGDIITASVTYC